MLSGKLPTGSLADDDGGDPVGPVAAPTPASTDETDTPGGSEPRATGDRAERLAAENERLRSRLEREREHRTQVVRRYERMLERTETTAGPNGNERARTTGEKREREQRRTVGASAADVRILVRTLRGRLDRLRARLDPRHRG